jgi:hypothetical protein
MTDHLGADEPTSADESLPGESSPNSGSGAGSRPPSPYMTSSGKPMMPRRVQEREQRIPPPQSSAQGSSRYGSSPRSRGTYQSSYSSYIPEDPKRSSGRSFSTNLTVIALVALLSFFAGFASRNTYNDVGGFDDERLVTAQQVPAKLSNFCYTYNGFPSFTVIQVTSVSTALMSNVPILRLDSCMIPVDQTANALQALGLRQRSEYIGPQLGGSNLTLLEIPLTGQLAQRLYSQFPSFSTNTRGEQEAINQLETAIDEALTAQVDGLSLQNLVKTSIPGVYVVIPGHSFNLQNKKL